MTRPPKLIYVGPADYDVRLLKRLDTLGQHDEGEILLKGGGKHSLTAGTLVHELLHAIIFESGLRKSTGLQLSYDNEEELVNVIAPWIYSVFFLDNPELNAYLSTERAA